jgi:hypothetical protein
MIAESKTLLWKENSISLRTAIVRDDGYEVFFAMLPRWLTTSIPGPRDRRGFENIVLFRRKRPLFALLGYSSLGATQQQLARSPFSPFLKHGLLKKWKRSFLIRRGLMGLEDNIKVMEFSKPPIFSLAWSDSGHSAALFLDGEPWAFIHEGTESGYSKGVLGTAVGNPWDQELFEETFLNSC